MHSTLVLLVMASIVASAPTYASGSCLSYGHSCWGAHGKRSGSESGVAAKLGLTERQARLAEYLLAQQQRRQEQRSPEEMGVEEPASSEDVLVMEQPPRLYQILTQLPRTYGKSPMLNN